MSNLTLEEELLNTINSYNPQKVRDLIQKGVNINFQDSDGLTALMIAKKRGHKKCISLFKQQNKEKKKDEFIEYIMKRVREELWKPDEIGAKLAHLDFVIKQYETMIEENKK